MNLPRPIILKYNKNNKIIKLEDKDEEEEKNKLRVEVIEIENDDYDNMGEFLMNKNNNILFRTEHSNLCNNKKMLRELLDDNKVNIYDGKKYNRTPFLRMGNMGFKNGICSLENLLKVVLLNDEKVFELNEMGSAKINDDEE